jgi:16S rRNA (uracil1498-N3)-methyltransferase
MAQAWRARRAAGGRSGRLYNPAVVPRFLVTPLDSTARLVDLPDGEGHHLAHVMRLGVGAEVRVFDGRGREHAARVSRIERRRVVVELMGEVAPVSEPAIGVVLAQGVLKAEAMDRVVRDATALGIAEFVPLVTARVTVSMPKSRAIPMRERWQRIAVASAKQCGRAVVPAITPPTSLEQWLAFGEEEASRQPSGGGPARGGPGVRLVLVEPQAGTSDRLDLAALRAEALAHAATIAIGPEGGWTAGEIAALEAHGFLRWSLGARTLRAETAPTVALAVVLYAWE